MPGKKVQEASQEKFSLYKMLELEKSSTVTTEDIKKQYRKLVLKYHPDKNKEDPQARQKFQKLKQAHDILTNPQKRKQYDQTGTISDIDENAFQSAYEYFRTLYKKVTVEQIEKFQKQYRGSPAQEEDLINYYNNHKGDMVQLLQSIPLSRQQDIPRFIKFYEDNIKSQKLKSYKLFGKTKDKVRLLEDQEEEWQEEQQKKKQSMNDLILAIRNKNTGKNFIDGLQQKYGLGKKKQISKKEKTTKSGTNKRR